MKWVTTLTWTLGCGFLVRGIFFDVNAAVAGAILIVAAVGNEHLFEMKQIHSALSHIHDAIETRIIREARK